METREENSHNQPVASPTPVCKPSPLFLKCKCYAGLCMPSAAEIFQNIKEEVLREARLNNLSIM